MWPKILLLLHVLAVILLGLAVVSVNLPWFDSFKMGIFLLSLVSLFLWPWNRVVS